MTDINQMSQPTFVTALGAVFEETPEVAAAIWHERPFADVGSLHGAMVAVVKAWPAAAQLRLILAHPELGSRVRMAEASVQEQAGAGLSGLSAEEFERFERLNNAYKQKFGFPFVMAVKGRDKAQILAAFDERLVNSADEERVRSLSEIFKIAEFRLNDLIQAFD